MTGLLITAASLVGFQSCWTLLFLPFKVWQYHLYYIDEDKHIQALRKKFLGCSSMLSNNEALGWVFGQWFIGYITVNGDARNKSYKAYLLAHRDLFEKITQGQNEIHRSAIVKRITVNIYDRCGSYDYFYYTERKLDVTDFIPRDNQQKAVDLISGYYKTKRNAVVLLSGPTSAGKSIVSLLLARALQGSVVYEFNPTEPGNNFNTLYNKATPTFEAPLVVTFEEADMMIEALHLGKILRHESKPIAVHNKATWNTFMDNIDHGFYPNVVFVLTTNRGAEWFDALDVSYMRAGRVNLKIALGHASCELCEDKEKCV